MKVLLNLGCGNRPLPHPKGGGVWVVINHDLTRHAPWVTQTWDLNKFPWPWPEGSIHQVHAHSVLEHLTIDLVTSMNECWRILKPNGRLDLKLPLWNRHLAYADPTHRWFVCRETLDNFDPTTERGQEYAFYGIMPWRILKVSMPSTAHCLRAELEALK